MIFTNFFLILWVLVIFALPDPDPNRNPDPKTLAKSIAGFCRTVTKHCWLDGSPIVCSG